jgi:hypothetical protein
MPNFGLSSARAEASRRNGAKSRGPKTPEGKARASQNALKHGLRAQKHMLLPGESTAEYQRLEAALLEELAPEGALQAVLARRVVAAAWRLERVERIEAEVFAWNLLGGGGRSLGLALIRDCNGGARAFDTLLRYRGGTLAEFWRALRTLKALQAEAAAPQAEVGVPEPRCFPEPHPMPIEPERRKNPCDSDRASNPAERNAEPGPDAARLPLPLPAPGGRATPIEPESRRNLGESAPQPAGEIAKNGSTSLLAGTAPRASLPAASLGTGPRWERVAGMNLLRRLSLRLVHDVDEALRRRGAAFQLGPVMWRQLDDHHRAGAERELRQDRLPRDVAPAHRQVQIAHPERDALGMRAEARHRGRPAEGIVHVQMVGIRRERP